VDYSQLVDAYIRQSGLSLAEITQKMKEEKGVKVDRTYISKLRKKPRYAATGEINKALAEVTGGDPNRLIWAGMIYGSDPLVREALMLIDDSVITKAMNLMQKIPNYFDLPDEEQEAFANDPDVIEFWNALGDGVTSTKYNPHANNLIKVGHHPSTVKDNPSPYLAYEKTSMINVPVLGCVQAGNPIEMIEHNEGYTLVDPNVLGGNPGFALRVKGDSMIGDRIQDGDIVIVSKQIEVQPNDIAVVAVNGDHATLKRVKRHGDMCMLVPSNPTMEPQLIPAKDIHILGKVVEVKFWPK
jgi:SOS regulatory protein LexA